MSLAPDRAPHGREIAEQRYARRAIEHDAADYERNLRRARRVGLPAREVEDVLLEHRLAIAISKQRFEDDADRDGKPGNPRSGVPLEGGKRVDVASLARAEIGLDLAVVA